MEKYYPEPIVGAFIFNEEGKLFLAKSHKWKGKWVIPGGHVEIGEMLREALKREVKEETNLEIEIEKLIMINEAIFDDNFWKKKHFIFFEFKCKKVGGEVRLNEELQEYGWFSLDEALKMNIEKYTRRVIMKLKNEV